MLRTRIPIALILLGVIGYGFFEAWALLSGPSITLATETYKPTTEAVIHVSGKTSRAVWISLGGRQIHIDEHGSFSEQLLIPLGYSTVLVEAKDRFGRKAEAVVSLVRIPAPKHGTGDTVSPKETQSEKPHS